MPRAARFKIPAIADLLRQLEYAPTETRRRHMLATEALIDDVDPKQNYPEDFIVYRITGYRRDSSDSPTTLVGEALLPDLVNLVQTLSERLSLRAEDAERPILTMPQVEERLKISHKTLQRYRKQGLVFRYYVFSDEVPRLACFEQTLDRFLTRKSGVGSFTRIEPALVQQIFSEAVQMRQQEGLSLNEAAKRLSKKYQRAHETIRLLLRRTDNRGVKSADQEAIFDDEGPLTPREVNFIYRAWQRGVESAELVKRLHKSRATIHRAINRRRREHLRSLKIDFIKLPTFELADASEVIRSSPAAQVGLQTLWDDEVLTVIEVARSETALDEDTEHNLIAAYNFLKMQAASGINALPDKPTSESLDEIETALRWAAMLRCRLIRFGFPAALRRIEHNFHRPLQMQAIDEITELLVLSVKVIANTVDHLDPSRGHRLERIIGLAMDKAVAKVVLLQGERASARHSRGDVPRHERLELHCSWDKWLTLRKDLHRQVGALERRAQQAVILRYGLEGAPPLTIFAVAERMKLKPISIVRLLQRAIRTLRAMVRQEAGSTSSTSPPG